MFMAALVAVAVVLVSSCGSSKSAQSELYETPCSGPGFRTEASHFRAAASAVAGNEDVARKQATASARQELATIINTNGQSRSGQLCKELCERRRSRDDATV